MLKLTEEQKELVKTRDFYRGELIAMLMAEKHPQNCTYIGSLSEQDCNIGLGLIEQKLGLNDGN